MTSLKNTKNLNNPKHPKKNRQRETPSPRQKYKSRSMTMRTRNLERKWRMRILRRIGMGKSGVRWG